MIVKDKLLAHFGTGRKAAKYFGIHESVFSKFYPVPMKHWPKVMKLKLDVSYEQLAKEVQQARKSQG